MQVGDLLGLSGGAPPYIGGNHVGKSPPVGVCARGVCVNVAFIFHQKHYKKTNIKMEVSGAPIQSF